MDLSISHQSTIIYSNLLLKRMMNKQITLLEIIENKIFELDSLLVRLMQWRENGEKIVFTNGCFDIIHRGHIDYLSKARDLGDRLIIGVNTDSSVRGLKGKNRPIQDEVSRATILAALGFVDAIVLFDSPTPEELINKIIPDVLVKGADYKIEDIVGYKTMVENNKEIKTIEFLEGYSTTKIENKIISLRENN